MKHFLGLMLLAAMGDSRGIDAVSFRGDVLPLLAHRCQLCHQGKHPQGKLSLTSFKSLLEGGQSGPAVKPGTPDESLLVQFVSGENPRMPKVGPPLAKHEVELIRRWIGEGAKDDTPAEAQTGQDAWWALRPLTRPAVPRVSSNWVRTPIDTFILAKLRERGLTPSPQADNPTQLRRLSFDLLGLPPTPGEMEAFVLDHSPDAYEKCVDRFLASPRYGERWARHWLDVVHYGDSHGYDKDKPRPNSWPYRDYVIRSFNTDKPYSRFVEEQLAGDVLFPNEPEALAATGFIVAGPWDFVGHVELREGTIDKRIARLLDRDDMVAATMSTFVSLTVHCARCHDHKFDPIKQEDYYSLQAVFAGVDRAERPYDQDPQTHRQRQILLDQKRSIQIELEPFLDKVEQTTSPEIVQLDEQVQELRRQLTELTRPKNEAQTMLKAQLEGGVQQGEKRRKELVEALIDPQDRQEMERLNAKMRGVDQRLEQLPQPQMVYAAAPFFTRTGNFRPPLRPRPVYLLSRGNVDAAGKLVEPGAVSCVKSPSARFILSDPTNEGSRRAALAEWIVHSDNMLTWRSIVNRVWHYHFGSGLVDTPNDFGRMGSLPSHPELLDWLAVWFRDEARGSLKALHKLIVTSAVYRQSSRHRAEGAQLDSENRMLWRMNRLRLDAESIRDSVLYLSGKLDLTMGGLAVQQFYFKDDHSPVYDYARFHVDSPGTYRRSIYRFIVRSAPDPFMDRLDCPDASLLSPKRSTTLTAIQALALLNNPFMVRMSQHFAERVKKSSDDLPAQILTIYRLALGRDPTLEESQMLAAYGNRYGLENACRLILNSNEFLFLD